MFRANGQALHLVEGMISSTKHKEPLSGISCQLECHGKLRSKLQEGWGKWAAKRRNISRFEQFISLKQEQNIKKQEGTNIKYFLTYKKNKDKPYF